MTIKKDIIIGILAVAVFICASIYITNNSKEAMLSSKLEIQKTDRAPISHTIKQDGKNATSEETKQNNDKNNQEIINNEENINNEKTKVAINEESINNNSNTIEEEISAEEEMVIQTFRTMEMNVTEATSGNKVDWEKVKDKINNVFFTTVDFLFYGKEINGVTFDELSDKTKLEILNIASRIDETIMKKFPNYKETIKDNGNKTYVFTKEQINKLQDTIKNKIGDDKYNNIAENIEKGKNKIIEFKDNTVNKIKDWYESKREKAKN